MVDSKCDVLLATRNFPPLIGGMERLNHFLYLALKEEYGVAIVGPSGCEKFVEPGTVVSARDARRVRSFLLRSSLDLIIKARTLRPKVVLAGSGLMGLPATMAARVCGAKTICYIHGLDIVAPDRVYQKLFVPAIGKIDSVWANSKNTMRLASHHGVREENMVVIPPPVQMPSSTTGSGQRFRERYGLLGKKLLLSVGRLTPRKGLVEFAEKVMPPLIERVPEACLVVIGGDAQDAVKRSVGELQRLREVFEARGLDQALQVIGRVDDRTLTEAYASSDLLILPVREIEGDVEGFGMVAIEAAAHGLPTVAFSSGGVPDAVEHGVSGYLVEPDDYDAMLNALIAVLSGGHDRAMKATSREFAGTFALDRFNKRVCDQLAALIA